MGWRKNVVDIGIFASVAIAVYLIVVSNKQSLAIIFALLALALSFFRRTIYDLLD